MPGAEKLLPNIRRLTDAARQGRVFLVSHGCFHTANDPEFQTFPPHCVKGTAGAELVPEALTGKVARVPNEAAAKVPEDLSQFHQILLEKQTLNIFESKHADELLQRLGKDPEFVVFGVVTEYCVSFAAKGLLQRGRRVAVVQDAIETLKKEEGHATLAELARLGARLTTTDQALEALRPQEPGLISSDDPGHGRDHGRDRDRGLRDYGARSSIPSVLPAATCEIRGADRVGSRQPIAGSNSARHYSIGDNRCSRDRRHDNNDDRHRHIRWLLLPTTKLLPLPIAANSACASFPVSSQSKTRSNMVSCAARATGLDQWRVISADLRIGFRVARHPPRIGPIGDQLQSFICR